MAIFFSMLMNFLVELFGKYAISTTIKITIGVAFVALVVAAISAYISAAGALISVIGYTVPDVVFGVWGWVMPSNTNTCFVSIGSVYILRFATYQYFLLMNARFRALASGK